MTKYSFNLRKDISQYKYLENFLKKLEESSQIFETGFVKIEIADDKEDKTVFSSKVEFSSFVPVTTYLASKITDEEIYFKEQITLESNFLSFNHPALIHAQLSDTLFLTVAFDCGDKEIKFIK